MADITLADGVAVITEADRGLGCAHALEIVRGGGRGVASHAGATAKKPHAGVIER
jgi:hypothetical protein